MINEVKQNVFLDDILSWSEEETSRVDKILPGVDNVDGSGKDTATSIESCLRGLDTKEKELLLTGGATDEGGGGGFYGSTAGGSLGRWLQEKADRT